MKLHLPKVLVAALTAVYAAALPLATTVGTGALVATAATYTAKATEHTDVSGETQYTNGDTYTLSGDTTFTGIPGGGTGATVNANSHSVTLQAAATNTQVVNFVTLNDVNNLTLSQGRYMINELGDFNGVTGNIDICGAQVWFTGTVDYTGDDAITKAMTIEGGTFAEGDHLASLNYSALRIGRDVEISALLTIGAARETRPAKISFQSGRTLTLSKGMSGSDNLLLGVYDGNNALAVTGATTSFTGILEFEKFREGSLTVKAGSAHGLHVGGIVGYNGVLGLVDGSTTAELTLDVEADQSHSFAGAIANGYSIVKTGAGTQTFSNTANSLSGNIDVQAGTLVYDGTLLNTDSITLTGSSTLALGGVVNITSQINNDAGTLVLKDGVLLKGTGLTVGDNKTIAAGGTFTWTGATESDLLKLVTNRANVEVRGKINRSFSNVTFQNGSILVIDNGQTVATAPTVAENASITLEVEKNETGTWSAAAQPSDTTVSISTVNIGTGGKLIAHQGALSQFCSFNHNKGKELTINLAATSAGEKVTTLETHGSIFGWDNEDSQAERTVNMGKGSRWLLHAVIDNEGNKSDIWFNNATTVLDNAQVIIDTDATVSVERRINTFRTETTSAGQSTISGGTIVLKEQDNLSDTKLVFDVNRSTALGESSTADLLVSSLITGATENNIEKNGTGILELTEVNTFTKAIDVNGGTLRLAGAGGKAGTGTITVDAGATLELAHTADCTTTNAITLNGNLLVSGGSTETLSGSITGTLQHVTLSDGATLGLSGAGTSMSIGSSKLTMGENSGFYLANNASLTLGRNSDNERVDKMALHVGGDGTGKLRFNMVNSDTLDTHKVIVLDEKSRVGGVYIESGCLAMSSSDNSALGDKASTNLRGADLHLASGANLVVTKNDGGNGNMGTVYLAGTSKLDAYGPVDAFTFSNNFTKESTGTAILEKTDGGAITLAGNVSLDQVKLTEGTLNLTGDLSLSGALTATKGTLNVSGNSNVIGGGLTVGNKDDTDQEANVVFGSYATINGNIAVGRGSLTFEKGAKLAGNVLDMSIGDKAVGHVVVSGGTVTNNGTVWSKGADNYIELQGSGKFIHESIEYSVRSDLSVDEHTRLYTTANKKIGISFGESDQETVISKAAINVLGMNAVTITAELSGVDILHQAGEGLTFANKSKNIRNLLDYTGHGITNSAALTVTGTLSLSGTLTLTGAGSLTFNAGNLVLDHGMSGFTTLNGNASQYSNGNNGYIHANSFVIIDASHNAAGLHITGNLAGGLSLSEAGDKVIYTVGGEGGGNDNTYYINEEVNYSEVAWREGGANDLVLVTDDHTLTLDQDFDSNHRLGTASGGWVALGNEVTVTNFGQTPADVHNIKVKTGESATISGAVTGIAPSKTSLESGSTLTVESDAQQTSALNFGTLTLAENSTLSTARDITAAIDSVAAAASPMGKVDVSAGATAVLNLRAQNDNQFMNVAISGEGTIELHNNSQEYIHFASQNNDFSGTLKVVISGRYIKFGNGDKGTMQTFASTATPDLVLEGGDGTHGIILMDCYAGTNTDTDPTVNAMRIGSLASDSPSAVIRGDLGVHDQRYIAVSQSKTTTFAGLFMNNDDRSVGLVMNGTGNLTLTNANQSTAGLYINSGTMTLGGERGAWAGAIKVAAGATLAYAGADKVLAAAQNITFTGTSTLKVESDTTLTLQKAVTANDASLSIADGGKLILGAGGSWSGNYVGGSGSTVVIGKTGNTQIGGNTAWADFGGTLDVAAGNVYVGAAGSFDAGADATLGASNVVVRSGASFITHFGKDETDAKVFGAAVYTEDGATIGNKDGHANWTGKIHLNVSNLSDTDTPQYNAGGTTTMLMHWAKKVMWKESVEGDGTLNIVGGVYDAGKSHCLKLNNDNTFSGTYRLVGGKDNDGTFLMELSLGHANAAKNAIIHIDASAAAEADKTNLLVGANATIAGLKGTAKGAVKADGGARTLTIDQSSHTEFAGAIANGDAEADVLGITKQNTGTLTLSGANTYTGATAVTDGKLKVTGSIGKTSSVAVSGDGVLEISGKSASVTAGGITATTNSANPGTAKKVTIGASDGVAGITGATSGDGDTLKALGEMSRMTLAFAAESTAAAIRNVTMRDVTLDATATNGTVTYTNAKAEAATTMAPTQMLYTAATSSETPQTLTAMAVQKGGTAAGTLTIDVTRELLRANFGSTLNWTFLDQVTLTSDFKVELGDILAGIVRDGLPKVYLTVGDRERTKLTTENFDDICITTAAGAGGLLAGTTGAVDVTLTIENVPEPTTGTLSVLALAALAARRRRE